MSAATLLDPPPTPPLAPAPASAAAAASPLTAPTPAPKLPAMEAVETRPAPPPPEADRPDQVAIIGDGTVPELDDAFWAYVNRQLAASVTKDDTPVDNLFSEIQMRLLVAPLKECWRGGPAHRPFFAAANVGLFSLLGLPAIVPDMMLSLDLVVPAAIDPHLDPKAHHSYFVGVTYDKPPDIVVEIVSNRVGGELSEKLVRYGRHGVGACVVFDPEHHLGAEDWHVARRDEGGGLTLRSVPPASDPSAVLLLPAAGLGLRLWRGKFEGTQETWLRWCEADGTLIPTSAERADQEQRRAEQERQRADQEQRRADQEQRRADQERQRADQEQRRAERLADRLRALGLDPHAP